MCTGSQACGGDSTPESSKNWPCVKIGGGNPKSHFGFGVGGGQGVDGWPGNKNALLTVTKNSAVAGCWPGGTTVAAVGTYLRSSHNAAHALTMAAGAALSGVHDIGQARRGNVSGVPGHPSQTPKTRRS